MKAVIQPTLPTTGKYRSPFFVASPSSSAMRWAATPTRCSPFAASRRTEASPFGSQDSHSARASGRIICNGNGQRCHGRARSSLPDSQAEVDALANLTTTSSKKSSPPREVVDAYMQDSTASSIGYWDANLGGYGIKLRVRPGLAPEKRNQAVSRMARETMGAIE